MTVPRTKATFRPPIIAAQQWLKGVAFPADRPLINVSQAAPTAPPPGPMRAAMAKALEETSTHLYGPDLGLPELRDALAGRWSDLYDGTVTADQVGITSGCNQAFAAVIATLCGEGDEVILPVPWYFNHKMWLDMSGVKTVPLSTGPDLIPDPKAAAALITPRTRAIALVSPNNPTGIEYPAEVIHGFRDLARDAGIQLILDETYRDFDSRTGAPHDLLADPDWSDTVIPLYSFSKSVRLTGHRVGAVMTSAQRLEEVEKFIDAVTICPAQLGQRAALWGLQNLTQWLAGERAEILSRRAAIETGFPRLARQGWRLRGVGAYFAYFEHPFAMSADELAPLLVQKAHVLALPATMFTAPDDPNGARHLRIAFANVDHAGITTLFDRLEALSLPLAPTGGAA